MKQLSFFDTTRDELAEVRRLIDQGFLFVVNHSGGKDSQAMYARLAPMIPAQQLTVVHAILHEVDWPGIPEHIEATVSHPVSYVAAAKSLLDMAAQRGMFPSPTQRQCTSDLKRGPIETFIRRYLKQHPEFQGRVVSCMGFRAEESPARAKLQTLVKSERNSRAGRTWYDWLPIHHLTTQGGVRRDQDSRPATPLGLPGRHDAALLRVLHHGEHPGLADSRSTQA